MDHAESDMVGMEERQENYVKPRSARNRNEFPIHTFAFWLLSAIQEAKYKYMPYTFTHDRGSFAVFTQSLLITGRNESGYTFTTRQSAKTVGGKILTQKVLLTVGHFKSGQGTDLVNCHVY